MGIPGFCSAFVFPMGAQMASSVPMDEFRTSKPGTQLGRNSENINMDEKYIGVRGWYGGCDYK